MQVTATLGAQAIRFVRVPTVTDEERVPIYPLLRGLQERYSFLQIPNKVEDFNFTNGVTFLRGWFENKIIEKFFKSMSAAFFATAKRTPIIAKDLLMTF